MRPISEQRYDVSATGPFKFAIRNAPTARGLIVEFGADANGNASGTVRIYIGDAVGSFPWLTVPSQTGRITLAPDVQNITIIPSPGSQGIVTCVLTDEQIGYGVYQLIAESSGPPPEVFGTKTLTFTGVTTAGITYAYYVLVEDTLGQLGPSSMANDGGSFANYIANNMQPQWISLDPDLSGGPVGVLKMWAPMSPARFIITQIVPPGTDPSTDTLAINGVQSGLIGAGIVPLQRSFSWVVEIPRLATNIP